MNEFRHDNGVRKVFPNALGARLAWCKVITQMCRNEPGFHISPVTFTPAACCPTAAGTRALLTDDAHQGLLYNPVNDAILPLPQLASSTDTCLWDSADSGAPNLSAKSLSKALF